MSRGAGRDRRPEGTQRAGGRAGERRMVPHARFGSYYGQPVLNGPVWKSPDIPGYLFLGGLAGASSLLGAGARVTGRHRLARASQLGALGAAVGSLVGLVHDLGRPARFLNMLRVVKVTSPMSVGSWLLAGYVPLAGVAALSSVTGRVPRIGTVATTGAAGLGPAVAAYTAALISDTAVPAWHDARRELPYVFVGSAATAAGGLGLVSAPAEEHRPALGLALFGVALELAAAEKMVRGGGTNGITAEPYSRGTGGRYLRASKALSLVGAAGALLAPRLRRNRRLTSAAAGTVLLAASAATRWGIFHAGLDSAADPQYTVRPQRERLDRRLGSAPEAANEPTGIQ